MCSHRFPLVGCPASTGPLRSMLGRTMAPRATDAEAAIRASGLKLYTYRIPWEHMNVSTDERALYESFMEPHEDHGPYAGAAHAIHRHLPRVLSAEHDVRVAEGSNTTLFWLPLSVWHVCFATKITSRPNLRAKWFNRSLPPPIEEVMGFVKFGSHMLMRTSAVWPRSALTPSCTCDAYERALSWTFEQPSWVAAPERHLWVFEYSHYARAALAAELRAGSTNHRAVSLLARLALGTIITQEDRLGDWEKLLEASRLVLVPFYSPRYFMYGSSSPPRAGAESISLSEVEQAVVPTKAPRPASAIAPPITSATASARSASPIGSAHVLPGKEVLAAESSGHLVACHRFDKGGKGGFWSCAEPAMREPNGVRRGMSRAASQLAHRHERNSSAGLCGLRVIDKASGSHGTVDALHAKASLYMRSTFCLVAPGDSLITPRIFSFAAAACVPVFPFPLKFLPFRSTIPWANLSLSVDPLAVGRFYLDCRTHEAAPEANRTSQIRNSHTDSQMTPKGSEPAAAHSSAPPHSALPHSAPPHSAPLESLPRNPLAFLPHLSPRHLTHMQSLLLHYRHYLQYDESSHREDNGDSAQGLGPRPASAVHALGLELAHRFAWAKPMRPRLRSHTSKYDR